jgi:hypothetical protein
MKLWQFLLTWLTLLLFVPSILVQRLFLIWRGPPGYPVEPPPIFIPFGIITFGKELWGQLTRGDILDALFTFILFILPIIAYTLILPFIINFHYPRILNFIQKKVRS